jgi:hypothetical protein
MKQFRTGSPKKIFFEIHSPLKFPHADAGYRKLSGSQRNLGEPTGASRSLLVSSTGRHWYSFYCDKPTPSQDRKVKRIGLPYIEDVNRKKFFAGGLFQKKPHFFGLDLANLVSVVSKWRQGFGQGNDPHTRICFSGQSAGQWSIHHSDSTAKSAISTVPLASRSAGSAPMFIHASVNRIIFNSG